MLKSDKFPKKKNQDANQRVYDFENICWTQNTNRLNWQRRRVYDKPDRMIGVQPAPLDRTLYNCYP